MSINCHENFLQRQYYTSLSPSSVLSESSFQKKSHTYVEGGVHLRISFRHLTMNFGKLKNQNFEKMKKIHNHMKYSSPDRELGRILLSFLAVFCHLSISRYYRFTLVYHKWWSYDVWFLKYRARQTKFFCHFRLFFALLPP